jgi:hypothetical protein
MTNKNEEASKTVKKSTLKTKNDGSCGCQCGCGTPNKQNPKRTKT